MIITCFVEINAQENQYGKRKIDPHEDFVIRFIRMIKDDYTKMNCIYRTAHDPDKYFGYGHKIIKEDNEYGLEVGLIIDQDRIHEIFKMDIDKSIKGCRKIYTKFDNLPRDIKQVIANMIYHFGYETIKGFHEMRRAIERRDWKGAIQEIQHHRLLYEIEHLKVKKLQNQIKKVHDKKMNGLPVDYDSDM